MFASLLTTILLIAYASAFAPISTHQQRSTTALNIIPITTGPTLNSDQAKAAGIGGLNGTTGVKSGGLGAFKVAPKGAKKEAAKKTPVAKKVPAKKANEAKKGGVGLFTRMPWQK